MQSVKQKSKAIVRRILVKFASGLKFVVAPAGQLEYCTYETVHLPEHFNRYGPQFVDNLHYKFYPKARGITEVSEKTYVLCLQGVRVFSSSGIVLSTNNFVISTTPKPDNNSLFLLENFFIRKVKAIKGKSLVIAARDAGSNYFHWMTDTLPKICIAEKAGYALSTIDTVLVSNDECAYQQVTLEHFGISKDKRISLADDPLIYCDNLIVPSTTCLSGNVPGWIVDFLRERFSEWMQPDSSASSKIYIGRKKSGKRVLLNEAELYQQLFKYGYKIHYLEDLSVEEQVRLFFNAKEIIGVHGAGLTNLIFAQPGCLVIELFPITYVNQCYWTIACKNKLHYAYLLGEGEDTTDTENHLIDSDFSISISKLIELRIKMLNRI